MTSHTAQRMGLLRLAGLGLLSLSIGLPACDDGDGGSQAPTHDATLQADLGDTPAQDAQPREDSRVSEPDAAPAQDATPPDDGGLRPVEDCADACAAYAECDRVDDLWGGDLAACQSACEAAQEYPRFENYLSCLRTSSCDALQNCALPQRPLPRCTEVCTAIEACDEAFRLPAGLPGFADCAAACEDGGAARQIASCGLEIAEEGLCDEAAFARCLLEERHPACLEQCDRQAACDDQLDAIDCALHCAAPIDDALANLRATELRTCIQNAQDCDATAACQQLAATQPQAITDLCAADAQSDCAFFDAQSCVDQASLSLGGRPDAVACLEASGCEEPLYTCFNRAASSENSCSTHCYYSSLCGALDEGQTEFDCREQCAEAALQGDGLLGAQFLCLSANSCEELAACRATAAPEQRCAALCEARGACELDTTDCLNRCQADFKTQRVQAALDCSELAGSCEAQARCVPPPAPACALICDALGACGDDTAQCLLDCDNAHFERPESFIEQLSCVNGTALCSARRACAQDPTPGFACRAWCEAQVGCEGGSEQELIDCTLSCAQVGVEGEPGLVFAAAEPCLQANLGGSCEELSACLDVAPSAFCDPLCAELDRCGLPDEDCAASCAADPEAHHEEGACVLNALRRGAGCAPVAACVGFVPDPPAPEACVQLCARQNACDETLDRFLCERLCSDPAPELPVQAACAAHASCAQLDLCLAAPAQIPPFCGDLCTQIDACDGLIGEPAGIYADEAQCQYDCAGASLLIEDNYAASLDACLEQAACEGEAILACVVDPRDGCIDSLAVIIACGLGDIVAQDPNQYLSDCRQNLVNDPVGTQQSLQCIVDFGETLGPNPNFFDCLDLINCVDLEDIGDIPLPF